MSYCEDIYTSRTVRPKFREARDRKESKYQCEENINSRSTLMTTTLPRLERGYSSAWVDQSLAGISLGVYVEYIRCTSTDVEVSYPLV